MALVSALLLALFSTAVAEEASDMLLRRAGFERLQSLSDELGGPDVSGIARKLLSGELGPEDISPGWALRRFAAALRNALAQSLRDLAPSVLTALGLNLLLSRRPSQALTLLCRVGCASALARGYAAAAEVAARAMLVARRVCEGVTPVLTAALSIAGLEASSAALSPMASLCAGLIERALSDVGLPLCGLAAIVACAGNLSERYRFTYLSAMLRQAVMWGVGALLTAFAGLMALEGRLASAQDTAAARALQQAVQSAVPIVGGQLSDSAGVLAASAALLKESVGVTGMLLAVWACAGPIARLFAHMLSVKLASAIIEPVADPGIARVVAGFSDAAQLLLAIAVGGAMLAVLLVGTFSGLLAL